MPTKKKTASKRELIEPHEGDRRYVRRKADGTFRKTVDVGRSLSADKRTEPRRKFLKARETGAIRNADLLDNAAIAELLIREAEKASGYREQAFRRAARAAFMWPEEGAVIAARGTSLTGLQGIGLSLARRLDAWFESPPSDIDPPPIRREFLTLAQARRTLAKKLRESLTAKHLPGRSVIALSKGLQSTDPGDAP